MTMTTPLAMDSTCMAWNDMYDNPFGNGFHLYGMEWSDQGIIFTVDTIEIGRVFPPDGGFWELGGFSGNNLWSSGSKMAPFDQDVIKISRKISF